MGNIFRISGSQVKVYKTVDEQAIEAGFWDQQQYPLVRVKNLETDTGTALLEAVRWYYMDRSLTGKVRGQTLKRPWKYCVFLAACDAAGEGNIGGHMTANTEVTTMLGILEGGR